MKFLIVTSLIFAVVGMALSKPEARKEIQSEEKVDLMCVASAINNAIKCFQSNLDTVAVTNAADNNVLQCILNLVNELKNCF